MKEVLHLYSSAALASGEHSPLALLLAFAVGIVSAIGPCTPSRLVWLSTAVSRVARPYPYVLVFVIGSVTLYAALALLGTVVQSLFSALPWLYGFLGVLALVMGVREVWGASSTHEHCHSEMRKPVSYGSAFLQGVLFAAMIQPCCTPLVLTIVTTVAPQDPVFGAAVLAAFGLGHGLPAFAVGPFARLRTRMEARGLAPVLSMVMGGIGIAVGGYFLVLA